MATERRNLYMFAGLGALLFVPFVWFVSLQVRRNSHDPAHEWRVRRGSIEWHIAARGRVEGVTSQEIKLASRIVGRLKEVKVNDGDPVHQGEVVAVLENEDLAAQVAQGRANLARAQAALEKLRNGARPEERDAARAQVDEARAAAENARLNYQRAQQLFKEGGIISQAVLDQAERDAKMAQAKLETARQNYNLIVAPPRYEDVAADKAQVDLARAQLAQAEDNYANTFVRCPVEGVVIKRYMNPGESISYESLYQPIVSVSDTTRLMVRTEIDETDIGKIQLGQRAEIRCDAYAGQTFYGHITRISGGLGKKKIQTDNPMEKVDTDVLETFAELDPGSPLRIGLRVDVYVPMASRDHVLIVPHQAVEMSDGVAVVRLRTPSGIRVQQIQLGAQDGFNVEVTAGVHEGDIVVY